LQLHRFSLVAAAETACGEKFGKDWGKQYASIGPQRASNNQVET
jgi:hypothetical protein